MYIWGSVALLALVLLGIIIRIRILSLFWAKEFKA